MTFCAAEGTGTFIAELQRWRPHVNLFRQACEAALPFLALILCLRCSVPRDADSPAVMASISLDADIMPAAAGQNSGQASLCGYWSASRWMPWCWLATERCFCWLGGGQSCGILPIRFLCLLCRGKRMGFGSWTKGDWVHRARKFRQSALARCHSAISTGQLMRRSRMPF